MRWLYRGVAPWQASEALVRALGAATSPYHGQRGGQVGNGRSGQIATGASGAV